MTQSKVARRAGPAKPNLGPLGQKANTLMEKEQGTCSVWPQGRAGLTPNAKSRAAELRNELWSKHRKDL